ncbi:TPA: PIN/TRAM domain-containing protein [Bacillus cereus]|nr:PIN/TRAM domain-containing protein [Bacillus cereus]HDR8251890.1 PIN/TRAM domain-containing protein [Bacillus cereus]
MLKRIVQLFFLVIGGALGIYLIPKIINVLDIGAVPLLEGSYVRAIIGAIILFLTTFWLVDYIVQLIKHIEEALVKAPVADVLFGTLGLISGLIVAYLILIPIREFTIPVISTVLQVFFTLLLGYLGFQVGFKKRNELLGLFTLPQRGGKKKNNSENEEVEVEAEKSTTHWKILDTSVIIDGRIADICQTKFLEGTIVIPQFVLEELQHIADSSDALKRNRGRRGLDILNRIQKEMPIPVEIYEGDFDDIQEVDSKLVKLAKITGGTVVTNDFNLNKVSELQGVTVLNINDLANAIKPVVLPSEELSVYVVKDGKEQNQGVAYLDDGTMIVVEDGREYVGSQLDVLVTSVLQTSAGRMIFAKRKLLEKAL